MVEKHYAFVKNGSVVNIGLFAYQDDALAQSVANEHSYDSFVWLSDSKVPALHSSWDGTNFTDPTLDYLYSIGISNENQAMVDARIAEEAAKAAANPPAEPTPTE